MNKILFQFVFIGLSSCGSTQSLPPPKAFPQSWRQDALPAQHDKLGETSLHPKSMPSIRPASQMTSLWSVSPKSLFGDRRAGKLGDLLTVEINIDEEAKWQNSTSTSSSSDRNMKISSFFGLPEWTKNVLPGGASLTPAVDTSSANTQAGQGNITRKEKLTLRLAARIVEVLPNGYLRLLGRQEVMVNNELRYLHVSGIIRTADISRLNAITYDKIADARIFYGGRGQISRAVDKKSGNKFLDKILPF